ncbi:MAG: family 20 glycosylhydrolase [Puia sp.]|nr:family 20 glycosylhydrolase [Puia sp.]
MNRTHASPVPLLIFLSCFLPSSFLYAQDLSADDGKYAIIPYPSSLTPKEGAFFIGKMTPVTEIPAGRSNTVRSSLFQNELAFLRQILRKALEGPVGENNPAKGPGAENAGNRSTAHPVLLQYDASIAMEEGYTLSVNSRRIILKARTSAGMFYAIQTLRQLLPTGMERGTSAVLSVPAVEIADQPAYPWRGLMLDVSRHFFSTAYLHTFIDRMALYKYNTFHLHLTDDQGWRIEIKKYPRLTSEGGWRTFNNQDSIDLDSYAQTGNPDFRMDPTHLRQRNGKTEHGGFYTQDEMKEIIRYAAARHIEIIPEIDMPGHMMAAVKLYPWLTCAGGPRPDGTWAFSDPICPCKDSALQFVKDILSEIIDLFPSKYIHIGGDEVDKRGWENSERCRAFMAQNNIATLEQLQSYFNDQLLAFFHEHGKILLGWDEIVEGGIDPSAAVMFWRPDAKQALVKATRNGNKVVMTPDGPFYFDAAPDSNTLKTVYRYNLNDPLYGLDENQQKNIIGVQGNLWTEWITTETRADYMLFPRMTALAELGWTHRDLYDSYLKRLDKQYGRLDEMGIHYYLPNIPGLTEMHVFTDTASFFIKSPIPSLTLRYTLDGTTPGWSSPVLSRPILIDHSLTIKLAGFSKGGNRSALNTVQYERQSYAKPIGAANPRPGLRCFFYKGYFSKTTEIKAAPDSAMQSGNAAVPAGIPEIPFALRFKGYIEVPERGIYRFFLTSDDGSVLHIANRLVVNNDGEHGPREKSGESALEKGQHPFSLDFTNAAYGYTLKLKYSKDGGPPQEVPASWFKSE